MLGQSEVARPEARRGTDSARAVVEGAVLSTLAQECVVVATQKIRCYGPISGRGRVVHDVVGAMDAG